MHLLRIQVIRKRACWLWKACSVLPDVLGLSCGVADGNTVGRGIEQLPMDLHPTMRKLCRLWVVFSDDLLIGTMTSSRVAKSVPRYLQVDGVGAADRAGLSVHEVSKVPFAWAPSRREHSHYA